MHYLLNDISIIALTCMTVSETKQLVFIGSATAGWIMKYTMRFM